VHGAPPGGAAAGGARADAQRPMADEQSSTGTLRAWMDDA